MVAGGDPERVVTVADFAGAAATGARTGMETITSISDVLCYRKLGEYAQYAAKGRVSIPIYRIRPMEDWREALDMSLSGRARARQARSASSTRSAAIGRGRHGSGPVANDAGQPPGDEVERLRIDGRRYLSRLRRQSGLGVLEQQPIEAGKLVYTISAVDRSSAG